MQTYIALGPSRGLLYFLTVLIQVLQTIQKATVRHSARPSPVQRVQVAANHSNNNCLAWLYHSYLQMFSSEHQGAWLVLQSQLLQTTTTGLVFAM